MKKLMIYSLVITFILGILGTGCLVYYSFQQDDITKFNWGGTAYLPKDRWGNVVADNNIFNADVTVTYIGGKQDDVLVQVIDNRGNLIAGPTPLIVGETITVSDIPWNSGTFLIQAKAKIEGVYEFKATNQKIVE